MTYVAPGTTNVPQYACWVPLPAPVAAGAATTSYVDPSGDVWVAKGNVNTGNWVRARDVLKCRIYRNAAWTPSATSAAFTFDTASRDTFGLANLSTGVITAPVGGWWRTVINIATGMAGASVNMGMATTINVNGTGYSQNNDNRVTSSAGNGIQQNPLHDEIFLNANDQLSVSFLAGGSATGRTGPNLTFAIFEYMGTG